MPPEITKDEHIGMMNRCKKEIVGLRAHIERLQPKADAYDNLTAIIGLLPKGGSLGMSEDLVWALDRRIRELNAPPTPEAP